MMAIDSAPYSLRRWVARFGVLAVSAQALLFIALWTPLVLYQILLRQSFHVEVLLFLLRFRVRSGDELTTGGGWQRLRHFYQL
jgi:hypothetical protein